MSKKKRPISPAGGGSSQPGQEIHPADAPADVADAGGAVPIGTPLPAEEQRALQRLARHHRKPPAPDVAQADPGEADDA